MPKFLENDLASAAEKHGFTGKRAARYIYGAMNNLGVMKGNKETPKGARMEAKHVAQMKAGTAAPMQKPSVNLTSLIKGGLRSQSNSYVKSSAPKSGAYPLGSGSHGFKCSGKSLC